MESTCRVYLIPGLGADGTIFRKLRFPAYCKPVCLNWIKPLAGESLHSYAGRMGAAIDRDQPFILVGMSLGGMLATELAAMTQPVCTILLSSVPSPEHLPRLYRLAGKAGVHRLIPVNLFRYGSLIKRWFTGEKKEDKTLLKRMIRSSDPAFIKWAVHAVLTWKGCPCRGSFYHIHGDRDGILPYRCTQPTHTIVKGTHMMVLTRAAEVSALIGEIISEKFAAE